MGTAPRYSIAVCNYNMAETLEASLRSVLEQIDDGFEVVVVDGGSTDGSRAVLRELDAEFPELRPVLDRSEECDHLGGDRNVAAQEARGEYLLESMDADDRYFPGVVEDFLRIFHALEGRREGPFFLSGTDINVAPRRLLLRVPYYDLGGAEDRDLWRRLIARDALVWLDHGPVAEEIGYEMDLRSRLGRDFEGKVCEFRSGVSFPSAMRWAVSGEHDYVLEDRREGLASVGKRAYDCLTFPLAYAEALRHDRHAAPPAFRRRGSLERWIAENGRSLAALEREYDFSLDRAAFSEAGRRAFCD